MKNYHPLLKVVFLLVIVISTFVYAMFQGGFVSWFLFYTTTFIIVTTFIFAFIPIGNVKVERKISSDRLVAGENLRVRIMITRKIPFPFLYFIVEDDIPDEWRLKNSQINNKEIIYPSTDKNLQYSYTIKRLNRGEYVFSKIKIRTSDLFGLFFKEKEVTVINEVIVYPNYQDITNLAMYNDNEAEAYITSQRIVEDVTSVAGSREYVPGDRLTSIDWKVTARISKLMTKEFEEYLGQRFLFTLDCSIKGREDALVFEKAVELAASLTVHTNKQQCHFGLLTIGKKINRYPVHYGEMHQASILKHLAKLHFQLGTAFDFIFTNELNKINKDTIVVIITTRVTEAMVENLRRLQKKGIRTAYCFVTDLGEPSNNEQARLALINKLDVPYYVVGKNSFQDDLQGGETFAQES